MKILLNAMIRTRSKWVCDNFHEYLSAKDVGKTHPKWPVCDLFTEIANSELLIKNEIYFSNDRLIISVLPYKNPILETRIRLKLLKQTTMSYSLKIHPTSLRELLLIDHMSKECDHYVTLCRKDILDQCLSSIMSMKSDSWEPNDKQKEVIEDHLREPTYISIEKWRNLVNKTLVTHEYMQSQPSKKLAYMEDTLSIRDSRDFCDMFNLEHIDFEFNNRFDIEFGNFKKNMIANYQELVYTYNEIITN